MLQHITLRHGTPPSRSSLKRPVAPLLDLTAFAAGPLRIVAFPAFRIQQPLGELPAVLRRQRTLPFRPTRNIFGGFLAAQARFRLLVHGGQSAADGGRHSNSRLTDSFRWMLRIALAKSSATETWWIFGSRFSSVSGIVSVMM